MEDFIALWQEKIKIAQGRPFDVLKDLGVLTFDIILAAALGLDESDSGTIQQLKHLRSVRDQLAVPGEPDTLYTFPEPQKAELLLAMEGVSVAATKAAASPSPWMFHFFNNLTPAMRKNLGLKNTIMQSYVNRACQRLVKEGSNFQPHAAVDYLVSREMTIAERAGREAVFNTPRMNDALFGYLVGGQDSTHSTLGFSKSLTRSIICEGRCH